MDPRVSDVGPKARAANLSPLMTAVLRASAGEKVNFCPFGCSDDDLDERGLCDHLIGYTNDGKTMEPVVLVGGRRTVQVPMGTDGKPRRLPIPPGAKLERITCSARVYHKGRLEPQKEAV
jgi:hypothetical protein